MKKNTFFAFLFLLPMWFIFAKCIQKTPSKVILSTNFDWQGHRGARGLLPENTLPAFLKAIDYNMTTLELDLAVSKDRELIVSHEPWFSENISTKPNGEAVTKAEAEKLLLYNLTYDEIKRYDIGKRGNPRFTEQLKMETYKPSLKDVVAAVKTYCKEKNKEMPRFNIEIKSEPQWDNLRHPAPVDFAALTLKNINNLGIKSISCVQSFDARVLEEVRKLDKKITIALLVENVRGLQYNLDRLTFQPNIYSPYYQLLTEKTIDSCHRKGIKVIPWTVNDSSDMKRLISWGVDGIITDYPNRKI